MTPEEIDIEKAKLKQADVEVRANIDTETVRALQFINGGLAAGLATMLPTIVREPQFKDLGLLMIVGIFFAIVGLVSAVVHNRLRRKCSLEYSKAKDKRQSAFKLKFLVWCQTVPNEPRVCTNSALAMWTSIGMFFFGATAVAYGFLLVQPEVPKLSAPCWELNHIGDHVYRFNRCTGFAEPYSGEKAK